MFITLISPVACTATPTPAPKLISVAVTDVTAPMLADLSAAYAHVQPGLTLSTTTTAALPSLSEGQIGLAASPDAGVFATPLGYVTFVVVVHPASPLAALSLEQARAIFTGQVTDWSQVGIGAGGAIQVFTRTPASDGGTAFGAEALRGAAVTPNAIVAPTWAAMREAVNADPLAMGYLPAPELDSTVKALQLDREPRVLIVALASAEPAGPARDFLAWAQSEEGQRVVRQKYEGISDP
jgi:phosphate transport system substrate-binding protein